MIPTFSVNQDYILYNQKIINLVNQLKQGKNFDSEYLYKVIDKIIKDDIDVKDISAYSKEIERMSRLKRSNSREDAIITEYEVLKGYKGVLLSQLKSNTFDEGCLSDVICIVEDFLNIRERLYYRMGIDVYILIVLSVNNDRFATKILKQTTEEDIELKDLIIDIIKTPGVLSKLSEILA